MQNLQQRPNTLSFTTCIDQALPSKSINVALLFLFFLHCVCFVLPALLSCGVSVSTLVLHHGSFISMCTMYLAEMSLNLRDLT